MTEPKMPVTCTICSKIYSTKSNLSRHQISNHKIYKKDIISNSIDKFANKCLEEGCNTSYRLTADLRHHLVETHGLEMEIEIIHFSCKGEFETWINDINTNNNLSYVRRDEFNKKNRAYFNCNRSGKIRLKSTNRKKALKRQGSSKIGYNCVSQIILIKNNDNTYKAIYHKSHYGHLNEVHHIRLSKQKRIEVASLLTNGITSTEVLDIYRNNFVEDNLSRANLITRKDINNIKSSFHINIQDGVQHKNDSISKDFLIKECQVAAKDILLYNKQENEALGEQSSEMGKGMQKATLLTQSTTEQEKSQCSAILANRHDNINVNLGKDKLKTELNELRLQIDLCKNTDLEPILPNMQKILKNAKCLLSGVHKISNRFSQENQLCQGEPANIKVKTEFLLPY